jgi:hypothetical protein
MLSEAAGVAPAFEVTPWTHPDTISQLQARGFVHDGDRDVTTLTRSVAAPPIDGPADVTVRPVGSDADVLLWQETSAIGWGHTGSDARRGSDAYARGSCRSRS